MRKCGFCTSWNRPRRTGPQGPLPDPVTWQITADAPFERLPTGRNGTRVLPAPPATFGSNAFLTAEASGGLPARSLRRLRIRDETDRGRQISHTPFRSNGPFWQPDAGPRSIPWSKLHEETEHTAGGTADGRNPAAPPVLREIPGHLRPVTTTVSGDAGRTDEADADELTAFADVIDRSLHAAIAHFTGGLSPAAVTQAWLDWATHLTWAPGKRYQS